MNLGALETGLFLSRRVMRKKEAGWWIWFCAACALGAAAQAMTWSSLGAGEKITAEGQIIGVERYAVPSFADWNNDGLKDLIIGEGPSGIVLPYTGKIRVYLNSGTLDQPLFTSYVYVQSSGAPLAVPAGNNCLGAFPRVVQWDGDGKKDLLIGLGDGTVRIYFNTGTDTWPVFGVWQTVKFGPADSKVPIYAVGGRATPVPVDWDCDGRKDIVLGSLDGYLRIYINEGTDTAPDFVTETFVKAVDGDLKVLGERSSPEIGDLNGDGRKDLLAGNTQGQLLIYLNIGTDGAPVFGDYLLVEADGQVIDLPSSVTQWARTRPYLCDWNNDNYWDVLLGWGEDKGYSSIYLGQVFAGDLEPDGDVDLEDFAVLAGWWMVSGCGQTTGCGGADLAADGQVDVLDLAAMAGNWMLGPRW